MIMRGKFATWIEKQYLDWQAAQGTRLSVEEFAKYLGVKRTTLIQWMNDQRNPNGKNIERLAIRLGIEAYDALDLERPEGKLWAIISHWEKIPEALQRQMAEQAEQYTVEKKRDEPAQAGKRVGKSK